jgi:hypothetical protein
MYAAEPQVAEEYARLAQMVAKRHPDLSARKQARKTSLLMLKRNKPDPALSVVARNTYAGLQDRYDSLPGEYRKAKGVLWLYEGALVGLYSVD